MANIQHRNIPDGEIHEIKGASSAIQGSVPISDGAGSTTFQKLGTSSLTGSIPSGIADLVVVTDGAGGFKAANPTYAQYNSVYGEIIPSSGFTANSSGFVPMTTGLYQVNINNYIKTVLTPEGGGSSVIVDALIKSAINRVDNGVAVYVGNSGLVTLLAGVRYRFGGESISIHKVV